MSLYFMEEICEGCRLAQFHLCCGNFCKCADGHEENVDFMHGKCEHKLLKESDNDK